MRPLPLLGLLLAACGGPLDSGFSGSWLGTTTVTSSGQTPFTYSSRLLVATSGSTATAANICPDGSGFITAEGSGNSAEWSGTNVCRPFASSTCSSITVTFKQASMELHEDASLYASGSGTLSGCGNNMPFTMTFNGRK